VLTPWLSPGLSSVCLGDLFGTPARPSNQSGRRGVAAASKTNPAPPFSGDIFPAASANSQWHPGDDDGIATVALLPDTPLA